MNMGSYPVKFPNGEMISPLGNSGRNIKASFSTDGKEATMSFNTTLDIGLYPDPASKRVLWKALKIMIVITESLFYFWANIVV